MTTLTFDDLLVPAERTVTLRGRPYPIRFVSAADMAVVESFLPMPDPPMVEDKTRGSLAPKVPNFKDEGYLRACDVVYRRWERARMAIALRYRTQGRLEWGEDFPEDKEQVARRGAFVIAASEELGKKFSDAEALALRKELAAFTPAALAADALKN